MDTRASPEKALLVAVATREVKQAEASLEELARLAHTAGADVVGRIVQRQHQIARTHYLGAGKLEELRNRQSELGYNLVIADDELSPVQQRNLEDAIKVKIIDRTALILDIFARHAHTREGQLQVELAQHQYLLPRLAGQWSHLERLGGGIGTRGPGESQLETDRRIIRRKIQRLEKQIEQMRNQRRLHRQKRQRNRLPVVALVGYTNAGKSTLLNTLSKAEVLVEDKLFATLDPTTRRLTLPGNRPVLVSDTVGFINKLPLALVHAFRATLEELEQADVLVHVVDMASPQAVEQCQTVENSLDELNVAGKPRVTALNKIDALLPPGEKWEETAAVDYLSGQELPQAASTVLISAVRRWGLVRLMEEIGLAVPGTGRPEYSPDF
jgi:GTP-binding protein HflX